MIRNIRPVRPGSDGRSYTITHDYSLKQVHLICFDFGVAVGGQIEPFSFADEPLKFLRAKAHARYCVGSLPCQWHFIHGIGGTSI